jgi:hypothetical protein
MKNMASSIIRGEGDDDGGGSSSDSDSGKDASADYSYSICQKITGLLLTQC